jgi:hypothetical protein
MAEEFLPEGFETMQLRAEYKKQAYLGDVLIPYVVKCDNAIIVSLKGEDGAVYVNVEFAGTANGN